MPLNKISSSPYESAPELLFDTIAEVNGLLAKIKAKSGESSSYKFWNRVNEVMKFAWDYIMELKEMRRQYNSLISYVRWLEDQHIEDEKKILKYEVVRELKISGEFDEVVGKVDVCIKRKEDFIESLTEFPHE